MKRHPKILDIVRHGDNALGPVQLIISIVFERLGDRPQDAWATSELIAAVAEFGPLHTPPVVMLGGTKIMPLKDEEDIGVAETALACQADLLVTADIIDFASGSRSALSTERLGASMTGNPEALLVRIS